MEQATVRVLTVDDHESFLRAARALLTATPGFEPVGEVSEPDEALGAIERLDPDLVFVDIYMPGVSGMELVKKIRAANPRPVMVLVSSHDFSEIPSTALSCGAAAVLRKQDLSREALQELWREHGAASARQ